MLLNVSVDHLYINNGAGGWAPSRLKLGATDELSTLP
jgi:hypothetical protein